MGQEEYRELSAFLARFIRRLRVLQGVEGLCLAAICLLLLFALGLAVQQIKTSLPYAPLAYSLLSALLLLLVLGRALFPWFRRVPVEQAALYIEKKCPDLRNNLINSLQLYPRLADEESGGAVSAPMVLALLRVTQRQLRALRADDLVSARQVKAKGRLLGILGAPVFAVIFLNPALVGDTFGLVLDPLKDVPPSQTSIEISPKGARVARGGSLTIEATASGAIPKSMQLILHPAAGGEEETIAMERVGAGKFSVTLRDLEKSMRYRAAAGVFSSPTYAIDAVDSPEIANIKVTLYAPNYTGLPTQTLDGGNVEGLKGSTARLEAASSKEVVKAKILFDGGREQPLKINGNRLEGTLVLLQSQKYEIVAEDAFGFHNHPIPYEIRVRPDGFPSVEILSPTGELEVNGDETLPLEYGARDDFGIQEINLVVQIGDRQEKIPVWKEANRRLITRERFNWELEKLGLRDGEEAAYHLEALDNDTISGPKLGTSKTLRLRLKNLKGEHKKVTDMIAELSRRMVDLLADHLEAPPQPGKEADQRMEQALDEMSKRVEEIMQRSEQDRLSDFAMWSDLEALQRNLQFAKEQSLQARQGGAEERAKRDDELSSELERMSLLTEEINKRLNAQETAATAQDLVKSQQRLLDSLEQLKSGDKKMDAVMKEISRLAGLLNALQQKLSQLASRLPDEFVNSDAVRGLNFNEMFSALDQIRKKLAQGDIDGARQLAEELFNQMASMLAALQNAQDSALASTMDRMQGEMARSTGELEDIVREQQNILIETEGIHKQGLEARDEGLKEKLERFLPKAQGELSRLAGLFPDDEGEGSAGAPPDRMDEATVNHLVKNMISRLLKKDFSGFAEIAEMTQKELGKKRGAAQEQKGREAEASLKGLQAELQALLGQPLAALSDAEKGSLRELSRREGLLQERTEKVHEKLDSLFQLFPSLDPQITKNIEEAGAAMGSARGRLGELDAPGAVPPERTALERLSQSQQQMQSAMQQLAQRGQLANMPVTRLFRMGRFLPNGMLVPMPGMAEFPPFDAEGGVTGLDTEKFRLPGKEDYKAPRSLREEILESLKQGVPPQLKEQIENYFKNLSE